MSESNKTVKAEIPASVDKIIQNLTDEPTKSIGTIISDLFYLVFGEISFKANKIRIKHSFALEQYHRELKESIDDIPPEKRVDPSLQVAAQALDNSKYCIDEAVLRKMFIALISNSMNSDYAAQIHPSFSEIIKQMSVLDATIIHLFKDEERLHFGFPVCQYRLKLSPTQSLSMPEHIFLDLPGSDIYLCSLSLSSLSRLGVVAITYGKHFTTPNAYDKFLQHDIYKELCEEMPFGEISISKGVVELTPFGRSFVTVCIPD